MITGHLQKDFFNAALQGRGPCDESSKREYEAREGKPTYPGKRKRPRGEEDRGCLAPERGGKGKAKVFGRRLAVVPAHRRQPLLHVPVILREKRKIRGSWEKGKGNRRYMFPRKQAART